jgi:hypothetical protein
MWMVLRKTMTMSSGSGSSPSSSEGVIRRSGKKVPRLQAGLEKFSRLACSTVMASVLLSGIASASSVITPSGDPGRAAGNPFDYANITVLSSSATYSSGSDVRDVFGGSFSTLEGPGHIIFADTPGAVTTYQITFQTASPMTISSYALYLGEDGTSLNRSATNFQLKANGNLISNVALAPQGQSYSSAFGSGFIKVTDTFGPVTGSTFQALFTANTGTFGGIRVFELDAFGGVANVGQQANGVPEPSSVGMALLGGLMLLPLLRRRGR